MSRKAASGLVSCRRAGRLRDCRRRCHGDGRPGGAAGAAGRVRRGAGAAPARSVEVVERTILDLQAEMTAGRTTARDIAAAHLARIAAYDKQGPAINALIALNPRALEDADALDRERRERGPRGPLHGIPLVIKDNYETADMPTTGGSVALAGFRPGRDAVQVAKLRAAGAVILGKTNLHELAAGIITISSLGGQTRNPYDLARTPGGSSGGTAAAVAASFAMGGMASDTCGSIRIPAANNNLFGLRGTLGLSSRTGIIPLSHTQDIGGPLARTVTDLALLLDATVGDDPADAITATGRDRRPKSFRDGAVGRRAEGRAHRRAEEPVRRRAGRRRGVGHRAEGARRDEGAGRGDRRDHHPRPRRGRGPVEPDQSRVQDRPDALPGAVPERAGEVAAGHPGPRRLSRRARGHVQAAERGGRRPRGDSAGAGPPPGAGGDGQRRARRAPRRGARLSDPPPPAGGGGGAAAGHHLSAERQHRLPRDGDAGRVHHRWRADRLRAAGAGLE